MFKSLPECECEMYKGRDREIGTVIYGSQMHLTSTWHDFFTLVGKPSKWTSLWWFSGKVKGMKGWLSLPSCSRECFVLVLKYKFSQVKNLWSKLKTFLRDSTFNHFLTNLRFVLKWQRHGKKLCKVGCLNSKEITSERTQECFNFSILVAVEPNKSFPPMFAVFIFILAAVTTKLFIANNETCKLFHSFDRKKNQTDHLN